MGALRYNSLLISTLDGGELSTSSSGHYIHEGRVPDDPMDRRMGGRRNQSGSCGEEKNICPYLESNPEFPVD
jgi:hypothetical protein